MDSHHIPMTNEFTVIVRGVKMIHPPADEDGFE